MKDEEIQGLLSVGFFEHAQGAYICDELPPYVLIAEYDKRTGRWVLQEIEESTGKLIRRLQGRSVLALWQEVLFNP